MDRNEAWVAVYTAALQGAITNYGVVEKEEDYQRLQKFCERSAKDATEALHRFQKQD